MSTAAAFAVVPARPAVVRRRARDLRTRASHVSPNADAASVPGGDDAATGRRGFISSVAAVTFAATGVLDVGRAPEARAFGCVPMRAGRSPGTGHPEMPTGSTESRANPVPVD